MVPTYGEDNFLLKIITLCLSNICIALFYIRIFHIVYLSFCLIPEFLGPPPTKTRSGMWRRLAEEPLAAVFRDSPREGKKNLCSCQKEICVPISTDCTMSLLPLRCCLGCKEKWWVTGWSRPFALLAGHSANTALQTKGNKSHCELTWFLDLLKTLW